MVERPDNLSKEPEAQPETDADASLKPATARSRAPKAKPSQKVRELLRAFNETKHPCYDPEPTETEAFKFDKPLAKAVSDGYAPDAMRYAVNYLKSFVATGRWSDERYITPKSAAEHIPDLVRRGAITKAGEVLIPIECLHEAHPNTPRSKMGVPSQNQNASGNFDTGNDGDDPELTATYDSIIKNGGYRLR